jgi:hypothetical protein
MPTTRPGTRLRPLLGQHALAAADVEDRLRGGLHEELVQRALEAAMSRRTTGLVEPYLS